MTARKNPEELQKRGPIERAGRRSFLFNLKMSEAEVRAMDRAKDHAGLSSRAAAVREGLRLLGGGDWPSEEELRPTFVPRPPEVVHYVPISCRARCCADPVVLDVTWRGEDRNLVRIRRCPRCERWNVFKMDGSGARWLGAPRTIKKARQLALARGTG